MSAAGAQGRHRAFVVAPRVAECVGLEVRMMQLRLGDVGHSAASGMGLRSLISRVTASVMKRAVIGVPS